MRSAGPRGSYTGITADTEFDWVSLMDIPYSIYFLADLLGSLCLSRFSSARAEIIPISPPPKTLLIFSLSNQRREHTH